jgi:hypothetical protein
VATVKNMNNTSRRDLDLDSSFFQFWKIYHRRTRLVRR